MTTKDSTLRIDKELGVIEKIVPIAVPKIIPNTIEVSEDDIENDYKYQRENFYNLVERGSDAIEGILELAKEGEHPRAYEVVGQLLKTVGETNGKLLEIHKMKKDITREEQEVSIRSQNVTNALFVGSTAELQKLLNDRKT